MAFQQVLHGDNLVIIKTLADESVDCVVTDPPYGLHNDNHAGLIKQWVLGNDGQQKKGFNDLAWDTLPAPSFWAALMPKLKPGAFLLVFASPRTVGLMATSLALAGFEIRDTIHWIYATGFGKQTTLDRVMRKKGGFSEDLINQWQGWAQGLQPAGEPIIVSRKPFRGSCLDNVLKYGTGALNIDACRIPSEDSHRKFKSDRQACRRVVFAKESRGSNSRPDAHPLGRWPKNVIFAHHPLCIPGGECHHNCQVARLQEQSGEVHFRDGRSRAKAAEMGISPFADRYFPTFHFEGQDHFGQRHEGCEDLLWVRDDSSPILWRLVDRAEYDATPDRDKIWGNIHPTVKPPGVMAWLLDLVAREGQTILDPFCGSGSTLVAAKKKGLNAIGIEKEHGYYIISLTRVLATAAPAGGQQCQSEIETSVAAPVVEREEKLVQEKLF